jgi:ferrochelatase
MRRWSPLAAFARQRLTVASPGNRGANWRLETELPPARQRGGQALRRYYRFDGPKRGTLDGSRNKPLQFVKVLVGTMTTSASRFGFVAFAETWNGRLAMLGFVIGLGTELLTGQGILSQLGLG